MIIEPKIVTELQTIVILEAISLALICVIVVASFKRWKYIVYLCSTLATITFFAAWSNIMALGSVLVYGPASALLWWQLDDGNRPDTKLDKILHAVTWSILAFGVCILILNNVHNIFIYLS